MTSTLKKISRRSITTLDSVINYDNDDEIDNELGWGDEIDYCAKLSGTLSFTESDNKMSEHYLVSSSSSSSVVSGNLGVACGGKLEPEKLVFEIVSVQIVKEGREKYVVRWGVSVQIIMTATKLSALLIIIILGIIMLGKGHTQNFNTAFEKSPDTAADVVFALYAGLWAYSGWDSINFAVEEVKNPYKLIPRTIYLSIFIITSIYLLTNVAYMAVLTGEEILQDHTVAVTFSLRTLGNYHLVVPILVGISAVGTVNALIFTSSRIFFVAAREHQLPSILAMINIKYFTPQPALILNCILALLVLVGGDFTSILNYYSFIRWATVGFSVYAQLWLRWKKPNLLRPIKFSIIVPVIFSIACTIVVVVPFYRQPVNCLIGIGLTLIAFPLYFFFLGWKKKPDCLNKSQDKFTIHCQKLLMVCPTEEEIK